MELFRCLASYSLRIFCCNLFKFNHSQTGTNLSSIFIYSESNLKSSKKRFWKVVTRLMADCKTEQTFNVIVKTRYADEPESNTQCIMTNVEAAKEWETFSSLLLRSDFNSLEYSVDLFECSIKRENFEIWGD